MLHFISAYHRRLTWTYFGLFIAIGMTGGLLGPALPHLAAASGSSMSQIVALSVAAMLWPLSRFASPTMPTVPQRVAVR